MFIVTLLVGAYNNNIFVDGFTIGKFANKSKKPIDESPSPCIYINYRNTQIKEYLCASLGGKTILLSASTYLVIIYVNLLNIILNPKYINYNAPP
jgi:hypothetical protein